MFGFEQRGGAVGLLGEVVERAEQDYCVGGGVRLGNGAGVSHLRGEGMLGLGIGSLLGLLDMKVHQVVQMDVIASARPDRGVGARAASHVDQPGRRSRQEAVEAVADLPDGFVPAGFSLGCIMAVHVATQRTVSGVLMVAGAIPVSALGDGVRWPAGVPAQTHSTLADPWREKEELDQTISDVEAGGGTIEVFDYPGSGHLFTDPTLPAEYDPDATETFWNRVLPFVRACGLTVDDTTLTPGG